MAHDCTELIKNKLNFIKLKSDNWIIYIYICMYLDDIYVGKKFERKTLSR